MKSIIFALIIASFAILNVVFSDNEFEDTVDLTIRHDEFHDTYCNSTNCCGYNEQCIKICPKDYIDDCEFCALKKQQKECPKDKKVDHCGCKPGYHRWHAPPHNCVKSCLCLSAKEYNYEKKCIN